MERVRPAETRRQALRFGGCGLAMAAGLSLPASMRAQRRAKANNILFYEFCGGISHTDTWDFKETEGTAGDLDVRPAGPDLLLPATLFPRFRKLAGRFAVVRSMAGEEEDHFSAQYRVQTGQAVDRERAGRIPSIGAVVAAAFQRPGGGRGSRPAAVSFNLRKSWPGPFSCGGLEITPAPADYDPAMMAEGRIGARDRRRYGESAAGLACALARDLLSEEAGTRYIHVCHTGWDHHVGIWDRRAEQNLYRQCAEFDAAFSSLVEDLSRIRSRANPAASLFEQTLLIAMGEFGRSPGKLNNMGGRDHHTRVFSALFGGAGVAGGRILGRSDARGETCLDTGWGRQEQPRMENVAATIYYALGIGGTEALPIAALYEEN